MNTHRRRFLRLCASATGGILLPCSERLFAADASSPTSAGPAPFRIVEKPTPLAGGPVLQCVIESPWLRQAQNPVRILLPAKHDAGKPTRVLYMLPVEAGLGTRWGDPVAEAIKTQIHDRHNLICVYPTFDTLPWFGRHAKDAGIRHEAYLLNAVVPAIESLYVTPGDANGRLLVGFSKSGFGAMSLILRNPKVFGCAGAWDAPLMMEDRDLGLFGTADHFGTKEVFSEYRPLRLIENADPDFQTRTRLVIAGEDSFGPNPPARFKDRPHTATFHVELDRLKIKHVFNNDLRVKHHWNTGWVRPVVDALAKLP
ncbi:alpha/beta hydrolase-fold protein [Humisphaera borealis]|uniref:Acyl-CoA:diacylglycerol acyltransferase n=1 Tax=Humisphaera borealis TaxID=2807512 RepID=A0A7M2WT36_9BACT|nr:alpha/beta hydrolase-fold protein [Humisphaera borealis]QOV88579.1 hypothetical protein IPV69_20390 [Humisphaera borealis]